MKNEALFRTGSVWKSIFSMAVPSIIIILVMVLYNMADMFFVGCLGDTAQVAAVSVVGPVFSILAAVATMLGAGSSAIIARCFGAGEIEQGKICSSLCFWTSFFLGVLVSIGLLVGRVPLLGMLGSNAEIFPYAERYLQVLALGAPCFILSNSMAMLVRAEGAVKEGMIGNLLGTLVNCIFDPLFILVLNFGVSGAAAASVLGNLVATACYLRYIVKHGTVLTVDFRPALKKPQMLGELLAIGLPLLHIAMCMVHSPNDRRALFDLIRWLSFRLLLLRWLGVHFCAITLLVSAQSCSAFLHTVTAQFCVVYGTLSRMRLGLEKPLRTRSTSCAFSNSANARVMLERLYLKSFDSLESG